jgi:uncharacterized membrane protein YphA (DoxX/SURF4 family)
VLLAGRLVLAGIFLFAAYGKLRPVFSSPWTLASLKVTPASLDLSMMSFAMQISSYGVLPVWGVMFVSHTLPWFELALGLLLVSGLVLRWTSLIATGLIAAFFGVLVHAYVAGLKINCGCFGPGAEPLTGGRLVLEALFLALAAGVTIGAFLRARPSSGSRASEVAASRGATPVNP